MNQGRCAKAIIYSALLMSSVFNADVLFAQENFRISRPSQAEKDANAFASAAPIQTALQSNFSAAISTPVQPYDITTSGVSGNTLKANATLNLEDQPSPQYQNAIFDWQNKNLPSSFAGQNGVASGDPNMPRHKGLKAHLGGAMVVLGGVAGSVAGSYVPVAPVRQAFRPGPVPKIDIVPGHCPAAFDPEFQVPVRWWDVLSHEESSAILGPPWKLWLAAVKNVFQAHGRELHDTPGAASLHVMVNPDGSICNITPYTGAERGNAGTAISERAMQNLHRIVSSVGGFPPFPQGSQVRCYHLIFNGSAGI
jgi:hypothetical protein